MYKRIILIMVAFMFALVPNLYADASLNQGVNSGLAFSPGSSSQGQGQQQNIDMGTNNYEAADLNDGRGFHVPGDIEYAPLINYFGKPLPSSAFQPLEQILMYECFFTEGALRNMLNKVEDADAEFKVANQMFTPAHLGNDGTTKWVKIVVQLDKYQASNMEFIGYLTGKSDDEDTTSVEVMALTALKALEGGANVVHFSAQGAIRDVKSFGWGFGFNTSQATLHSSDNDSSNISSGGMGVSGGRAGMRDMPWLQGFALVDHDLVYPVIEIPEPAAPAEETEAEEEEAAPQTSGVKADRYVVM